MMFGNGWGGEFGMWHGFGWIFMLLFWTLVIMGIIYIVKSLISTNTNTGQRETPEDILRKRYAGGEISKEEFEESLKTLKQHSG